MSHFGDLLSGKTKATTVPTPVVEEAPRPEEEIADAVSEEKNFSDMSKEELEIYGRTIGIELDRRHNKSKLIKELEEHIQYIESV
tara:strand:- start:250 stop:504 length:255 start_codon:yes stop_codon:yes gene_type:complete